MKFRTDRLIDQYKWCPDCGASSAKRFRKCHKCGATLATANEWGPRKELVEPAAQERRATKEEPCHMCCPGGNPCPCDRRPDGEDEFCDCSHDVTLGRDN